MTLSVKCLSQSPCFGLTDPDQIPVCSTDQRDVGCTFTRVNLPIRRLDTGGQGSTDAGAGAYPDAALVERGSV